MSDHDVLEKLSDRSSCGYPVLKRHLELARSCAEIEGDIVECGVLNGGSAGAIAYGLPGRTVWLYDSFQGFPDPSPNDPPETWNYVGIPRLVGDIEKVTDSLAVGGCFADSEHGFVIRAGWFEKTFELDLPEKVAYLHIDCDWYESVMLTLKTFYDRVSPGGVIVIDDWAWWEGARQAFYDWVSIRGDVNPLIDTFGHCQAYWRKEEIHRRVR